MMTSAISSPMEASACLTTSTVIGSTGSALMDHLHSDVAGRIAANESIGRNDTGRIIFLDDERAGPRRRVKLAARDHRDFDRPVARPEIGTPHGALPVRRIFRPGKAIRRLLPATAQDLEADDRHRILPGPVTEGPAMFG